MSSANSNYKNQKRSENLVAHIVDEELKKKKLKDSRKLRFYSELAKAARIDQNSRRINMINNTERDKLRRATRGQGEILWVCLKGTHHERYGEICQVVWDPEEEMWFDGFGFWTDEPGQPCYLEFIDLGPVEDPAFVILRNNLLEYLHDALKVSLARDKTSGTNFVSAYTQGIKDTIRAMHNDREIVVSKVQS